MTHILIVDDDIDLCNLLADLLTNDTCKVTTAYSGEEALATLSDHQFDLMLLDVEMPAMDGLTVLKKIRRRGQNLPVILVTGTTEARIKQGKALGARGVLRKPLFQTEKIFSTVKNALDNSAF